MTTDTIISELARRQFGVVTRRQLLAAKVSADAVDRRIRSGLLRPHYRGVFLTGAVQTPRTELLAAALACGGHATVSHRSAAILLRLRKVPKVVSPEVIVRAGQPQYEGITVYRMRTLREDETTKVDGIPVTTAARTLVDLCAVVSMRQVEQAYAEALALRLTTPAQVRAVLARHPLLPGVGKLRKLLGRDHAARTRSTAEERFLALVRKAGAPPPEVNRTIAGFEVDFYWPDARAIAEVDGRRYHEPEPVFEKDRRRDQVLTAAGYSVIRVTWRQLTAEREALLFRLATILTRASA